MLLTAAFFVCWLFVLISASIESMTKRTLASLRTNTAPDGWLLLNPRAERLVLVWV